MEEILLILDENQIASLQQDFKHKAAGYKARIKVLTETLKPGDDDDALINIQNRLIIYDYLAKRFATTVRLIQIKQARTRAQG